MTVHSLEIELEFEARIPSKDTDENFDDFTTHVMDALCDLEEVDSGITDSDITVRIVDRSMHVMIGIEADTRDDAGRLFLANIRTALHATGCHTAGWPAYEPPNDLPSPRETSLAGS